VLGQRLEDPGAQCIVRSEPSRGAGDVIGVTGYGLVDDLRTSCDRGALHLIGTSECELDLQPRVLLLAACQGEANAFAGEFHWVQGVAGQRPGRGGNGGDTEYQDGRGRDRDAPGPWGQIDLRPRAPTCAG